MAKRRRRSRGFAGSPEEHGRSADMAYARAIRGTKMTQSSLTSGNCGAAIISYGLAQKAMGEGDESRKWGGMVDADQHEQAQYAMSDIEGALLNKCLIRR